MCWSRGHFCSVQTKASAIEFSSCEVSECQKENETLGSEWRLRQKAEFQTTVLTHLEGFAGRRAALEVSGAHPGASRESTSPALHEARTLLGASAGVSLSRLLPSHSALFHQKAMRLPVPHSFVTAALEKRVREELVTLSGGSWRWLRHAAKEHLLHHCGHFRTLRRAIVMIAGALE